MGFLRSLVDVGKEANEDAHGQRLITGVNSTFSLIQKFNTPVQETICMGYMQILNRLLTQCTNLSREEKIELGRTMQMQAQAKFDLDVTGSYAKWMAGAWLESGARTGDKSVEAHYRLNELANDMNHGSND
jgi:hypothetical protein